jgi:hypothetical protein
MGSFFKEAGSDLGDFAKLMQQVKLTSDQESKLSGAAAAAHTDGKMAREL